LLTRFCPTFPGSPSVRSEFVIDADNQHHPRILLVAAHPDDETIGAGALLSRNKHVSILHATDGAPLAMSDALNAGFSSREAYGSARIAEAREALGLAGVEASAIFNMRLIDQQLSFRLAELTVRIVETLTREAPDIVLTHAYEGGHPDHDSVAFACHTAHEICSHSQRCPAPRLMEFAGYHGENGSIKTYEFLFAMGTQEIQHRLTLNEENLKTLMLTTFRTQAKTLQPFLPPQIEKYRDPPKYDFDRPPHSGKLFYEHFDWGMDGATWRGLAQDALVELNLPRRKSCGASPS
jgi:LmbE family N-acetylglucosaminyl deacetylase